MKQNFLSSVKNMNIMLTKKYYDGYID